MLLTINKWLLTIAQYLLMKIKQKVAFLNLA